VRPVATDVNDVKVRKSDHAVGVKRLSLTRRQLFLTAAVVGALVASAACSAPSAPNSDAGSSTSSASPQSNTPPAGSTSSPATPSSLQKALDDLRSQAGFPGAIAGVWSPDITWIGTTGTVGTGQDQPPAPDDHTRVGSLTKTITATILLQLVQEQKVSLDDPIGKYVEGIPNNEATLRQLADMTSGIPIYSAQQTFQDALYAKPQAPWTPTQLISYIRDVKPDFPPGKGWEYDNTNYVLLGMVIEKVTGAPIAKVYQDRIFGPLQMTDTSFPNDSTVLPEPYLSGVTNQGQPTGKTADSTHWNPSSAYTAGAIISTFNDLKKWADALFTGKGILDPATQQLRRDSIIRNIPPNTAQAGYGIGIGDRDGWWGHDGDLPGYTTSLFHNYELDTTIIVVVNSDITIPGTNPPADPAPAIFGALAGSLS
jgi:D-alanyl-D-alanine carboxypeptidase